MAFFYETCDVLTESLSNDLPEDYKKIVKDIILSASKEQAFDPGGLTKTQVHTFNAWTKQIDKGTIYNCYTAHYYESAYGGGLYIPCPNIGKIKKLISEKTAKHGLNVKKKHIPSIAKAALRAAIIGNMGGSIHGDTSPYYYDSFAKRSSDDEYIIVFCATREGKGLDYDGAWEICCLKATDKNLAKFGLN